MADDFPMEPDGAGKTAASDAPPKALVRREDVALGGVLIRPSVLTVEGPEGSARTEPRVMQVLMTFVDAGYKVLSRDDLIRECWEGRIVGDDSIHRVIGELRKLARQTGAGFAIETIPRVGYKLSGLNPGRPGDPQVSIAPPANRRWILGAAAAGAGALAFGAWSIRESSADPRFAALMDQGGKLLRSELPGSEEQAANLFGQATKIDADSASAWGLLALSTTGLGYENSRVLSPDVVRSVEEFAKHALALDQREPNALLAKTLLQSRLDDWVTTENKFRQILDIAPDHIPAMANLVFLLQGVGRSHESWNLGNRAIAVDPMIPTLQFRHAFKLWIFGRIGEADRVVDRARELWPWHPWVWIARLLIFSFTGRPSAALAMVEDGADRPASWPKPGIDLWRASLAALESRQSSDVAEAREAIFRAAPLGAGFAIHGAMLLSAMGEIDAAYAVVDGILLRRGKLVPGSPTTDRSWLSTQWVFTPATAPLRADPRFAGLCDGIGLMAYWRRRGVWPDPFLRGSLEIKA